jgi:hypothetical protein
MKMNTSIKTKAVILCILIFAVGVLSGWTLKSIISKRSEYNFQYRFERLEPLTEELHLNDVQRALLFNILADHKNAVESLMKPLDHKIKMQLHILRENIKAVLDDGQKTIYERLLQEYRQRKAEENQQEQSV